MNKFSQVDFVKNNLGLDMAKSFIVDLPAESLPEGLEFPCLVKPVATLEGKKGDIRRFEDAEALMKYLVVLRGKGYERILVQKFLDIDYEFCLSGCCGEVISYFVSKTVRAWPNVGGTGSWDNVMDEQDIHELCVNILQKLSDMGYSGLIDIELFKVGKKVYLCEINWRDSGRVFMCLGTKVYYPLVWYYSVTGQQDKISGMQLTTKDTTQFGMCEESDIHHVLHAEPGFPRIKLSQWIHDIKSAQSLSVWHPDDKKPSFWLWTSPRTLILTLMSNPMKNFIKRLLKV